MTSQSSQAGQHDPAIDLPASGAEGLAEGLQHRLGQQHRRLQGVQAPANADARVRVPRALAVHADLAHGLDQGVVFGEDGAAVAVAAERLGREETGAADGGQVAALAAVSGDLTAVHMMREAFARRGALMHKMLSTIPGVTCMEPQGAFYCFPNFSGLLNRDIKGKTAKTTMELADMILTDVNVAIVPGEAFGAPGFARFSFALGDDDLVDGIQRIIDYVA